MKLDWLIIGLGNPGEQYNWTRHNYGFLALDYLQNFWDFPEFQYNKYHRADFSQSQIWNQTIGLLKPQTFMNRSGESIEKLKAQLPPEKIIVIYDDIDLPLGNLRIRSKGSAGTHNGMKSIIKHLNGSGFPRIRCGIKPNHKIGNMASFVLAPFNRKEKDVIQDLLPEIAQAIDLIMNKSLQEASQKYNKKSRC